MCLWSTFRGETLRQQPILKPHPCTPHKCMYAQLNDAATPNSDRQRRHTGANNGRPQLFASHTHTKAHNRRHQSGQRLGDGGIKNSGPQLFRLLPCVVVPLFRCGFPKLTRREIRPEKLPTCVWDTRRRT